MPACFLAAWWSVGRNPVQAFFSHPSREFVAFVRSDSSNTTLHMYVDFTSLPHPPCFSPRPDQAEEYADSELLRGMYDNSANSQVRKGWGCVVARTVHRKRNICRDSERETETEKTLFDLCTLVSLRREEWGHMFFLTRVNMYHKHIRARSHARTHTGIWQLISAPRLLGVCSLRAFCCTRNHGAPYIPPNFRHASALPNPRPPNVACTASGVQLTGAEHATPTRPRAVLSHSSHPYKPQERQQTYNRTGG